MTQNVLKMGGTKNVNDEKEENEYKKEVSVVYVSTAVKKDRELKIVIKE